MQLIYLCYFSVGPTFWDILAKTGAATIVVIEECNLTFIIHSFLFFVFSPPYHAKEECVKRAPSPMPSVLSSFHSLRKTTSSCDEKYDKLNMTFFIVT